MQMKEGDVAPVCSCRAYPKGHDAALTPLLGEQHRGERLGLVHGVVEHVADGADNCIQNIQHAARTLVDEQHDDVA